MATNQNASSEREPPDAYGTWKASTSTWLRLTRTSQRPTKSSASLISALGHTYSPGSASSGKQSVCTTLRIFTHWSLDREPWLLKYQQHQNLLELICYANSDPANGEFQDALCFINNFSRRFQWMIKFKNHCCRLLCLLEDHLWQTGNF